MLKEVRFSSLYCGKGDAVRKAFLQEVLCRTESFSCWFPTVSLQELLRSTFGILELIRHGGRARFLLRTDLSIFASESVTAPQDNDRSPFEQVSQILDYALTPRDRIRIGLLAWLLANGRLEIRFALSTGKQQQDVFAGQPPSLSGIVTDEKGNALGYELYDAEDAATGTLQADCIWSWGDPGRRIAARKRLFDRIWDSKLSSVSVMPLPDELRRKLLTFVPVALPDEEPPVDETDTGVKPSLYHHQELALESWAKNSHRGIFKMCTGAGKTRASLEGIRRLDSSLRASGQQGLTTVVVVCPTQVLVEQWSTEARNYGFETPLLAYSAFNHYVSTLVPALNQQTRTDDNLRLVITTFATFGDKSFAGALNVAKGFGKITGLLVADEVHCASTVAARARLNDYSTLFQYRLGLSATPEIETDPAAQRALFSYFGGIIATYKLDDAIRDGVLCHYRYYPIPTPLDPATSRKFFEILQSMDEAEVGHKVDINLYRERSDLLRKSDLAVDTFGCLMQGKVAAGETISHTLVYCPPGRAAEGIEDDEDADAVDSAPRHINKIADILTRLNISKTAILGGYSPQRRKDSLANFATGEYQVLLGIGCLDEGLDVPGIREAIVLYSCDRERQFVQRRGRILRRAPGKDYAVIRDIILLPQNSDLPTSVAEKLITREMRRYNEFASLADNKADAERILSDALTAAANTR